MSEQLNPYYSAEKLGLELLAFEEPNLSWEFNTLCFWATPDGRVYTANDCGCSCPTPFEDFEGETTDAVLDTLERVGSIMQALEAFDSWNGQISRDKLGAAERRHCEDWVRAQFAKSGQQQVAK